jgi:hypothetical protein
MWAKLVAVWPGQAARRRVLQGAVVSAVAVAAFCWGKHGGTSPASAQQQPGRSNLALSPSQSDYDRRVVAVIHGNIPITREELGEYLIARFGAERVEFLVNRRIIEHACHAHRIHVSDAEVDQEYAADLKAMNLSEKDFLGLLKRSNKTLFEYREDVIRPKLAMQKMCRGRVEVTEADLRKAFEARYGEQVVCRMIVLQKEMKPKAPEIWARVRASEEEFDKESMSQFIPALASKKGLVPPIHRHFPDPLIENAAFTLRNYGDTSELLPMPDGSFVILKLVERKPANMAAKFEEERVGLEREVFQAKLAMSIQPMFNELRARARPEIILRRDGSPQEQDRQITEQLRGTHLPGAPAPRGN